jgi:hypothetical protein
MEGLAGGQGHTAGPVHIEQGLFTCALVSGVAWWSVQTLIYAQPPPGHGHDQWPPAHLAFAA